MHRERQRKRVENKVFKSTWYLDLRFNMMFNPNSVLFLVFSCTYIFVLELINSSLSTGTREQAYVYAISSASLVHSIARACSVGVTTKCSCGALPNHPPHEDFKWGGCGDDLKYGLYFSEQFTDAELMKKGKIRKSKKSQMNSHNNAVGRLVGLLVDCEVLN